MAGSAPGSVQGGITWYYLSPEITSGVYFHGKGVFFVLNLKVFSLKVYSLLNKELF